MYKVTFTFFDGETVEVAVNDADIDKFLNVIGENRVFFNDAKTAGTWLNGSQVRYFQAIKERSYEEVAEVRHGEAVLDAKDEAVS